MHSIASRGMNGMGHDDEADVRQQQWSNTLHDVMLLVVGASDRARC